MYGFIIRSLGSGVGLSELCLPLAPDPKYTPFTGCVILNKLPNFSRFGLFDYKWINGSYYFSSNSQDNKMRILLNNNIKFLVSVCFFFLTYGKRKYYRLSNLTSENYFSCSWRLQSLSSRY